MRSGCVQVVMMWMWFAGLGCQKTQEARSAVEKAAPAARDRSKDVLEGVEKVRAPEVAEGGGAEIITVDLSTVKWTAGDLNALKYTDGPPKLGFWVNGTAELAVQVPVDGKYSLIVNASSQPGAGEHAKFRVAVDGKDVGEETTCVGETAHDYLFVTSLRVGERKIAISFGNDASKPGEWDRNFFVTGLRLVPIK